MQKMGWLWGTQGHGQCHHSIVVTYDSLFDLNRNFVSIFSRFSRTPICDRQTQTNTGPWLVPRMHGIARYRGKGSPYSITERRVPELIPVFGSQPAGDVSHKPGGRLPLLSGRPAVTPTTLKRAATNTAVW